MPQSFEIVARLDPVLADSLVPAPDSDVILPRQHSELPRYSYLCTYLSAQYRVQLRAVITPNSNSSCRLLLCNSNTKYAKAPVIMQPQSTQQSAQSSHPESLAIQDLTLNNDCETYQLGTFKLKSGDKIPDAFIAYKTLGDPTLPAVIYPTWYSGG